ncbi:MAG: hypothetical protein RIS64_4504, partial [Bacteroidota bacterium]
REKEIFFAKKFLFPSFRGFKWDTSFRHLKFYRNNFPIALFLDFQSALTPHSKRILIFLRKKFLYLETIITFAKNIIELT